MSNGPSDEDVRRAARATKEARETAKAMAPVVDASKLDPKLLKSVLDKYAPGSDADDDGIYDQRWLAVETFYRHTEGYVEVAKRLEYKHALERAFPPKRGAL